MAAPAVDRDARLADSEAKIRAPFRLDPSMRFYSPQENRDALSHPTVAAWLDYVTDRWEPSVPGPGPGGRRLALLLPCTKYKPYPTSREHRAVNGALLDAGWAPHPQGAADARPPDELLAVLDDGEPAALLDARPLHRDGVTLDRFVISEPLAIVPYEHVFTWGDAQSPATSYDDPGLFESRGSSVSPHRQDSTAVQRRDGTWRWGPNERDAFVDVHDVLVDALTTALRRLAPLYAAIVGWASPGLTHRSFLADEAFRRAEGMPMTRRGASGPRRLTGVNDGEPGLVELRPTADDLAAASSALADRLAAEGRPSGAGSVRAVMARGDGADTPLGLPEALQLLVARLDELAAG